MWRKRAGLAAEGSLPLVQPLSLTPFDSSPSRGASGETVHFAGTAKASPTRSNGDDRRQWRKQGGAVGAAASRMRAAAKQTLGAATRAVASRSDDGEVVLRQSLPLVGKSGSQHRFLYLFVEVYDIMSLRSIPAILMGKGVTL